MTLRITLFLLLVFQKDTIPPYGGDDNPRHDGQPMWCQNHDNGKHAKNCSCKAMNKDGETCSNNQESESCKVYCRKAACRCANPCAT